MLGTTRLLPLAPAPKEELRMKGWHNSAWNGDQLNPRDKPEQVKGRSQAQPLVPVGEPVLSRLMVSPAAQERNCLASISTPGPIPSVKHHPASAHHAQPQMSDPWTRSSPLCQRREGGNWKQRDDTMGKQTRAERDRVFTGDK